MSTYNLSIVASGSNQDNAASRDLDVLFPFVADTYRTVSQITRVNGIWCSCGGTSQSVTLEGYDQLIDASTGTIIKTSANGICKCKGTGPSDENLMTTVFTFTDDAVGQMESNAVIAAWAAGNLRITRTVWIKSYSSSGHGDPTFRDGYYDDVITIVGSTQPFTEYLPEILAFTVYRSADGVTATQLSEKVYAKIQITMNDTTGLTDSPQLAIQYAMQPEFADATTITLGTTQATITPYFTMQTVLLGETFSVGSHYYFRLGFTAGQEAAANAVASVGMSYTPIHIPGNNRGLAMGMYSNAQDGDERCEINFPIFAYKGFADVNGESFLTQIGIQSGVTEQTTVSSNSYKDVEVTFPNAYADAEPMVMVCFASGSTAGYFGRVGVSVVSRSQTGCTVRIFNGDSSNRSPRVNWMAFGKPNSGGPIIVNYVYPTSAMTANSSQSCVVSASSIYGSAYAAYKAFDKQVSTGWASDSGTVSGGSVSQATWLQIQVPVALQNIQVDIYARDNSNIGNPTAGEVLGSVDGVNFTPIGSFSGWSSSASDGSLLGTVICGNTTPYNYIRLSFTAGSSMSYIAVGEMIVHGTREQS